MDLNQIEAQGAEAYRQGKSQNDNPYMYRINAEANDAWFTGYIMEKQRQEMQKLADEEE